MITRIKADHPDLRVLVLSMSDDILIALRAMRLVPLATFLRIALASATRPYIKLRLQEIPRS